MAEKPILGSGPGTFMVGYKRLKTPASEIIFQSPNPTRYVCYAK